MSLILSAGRLMALGIPWEVAQILTNINGQGLSLAIGPGELLYESASDTLTAHAGGGQANALQLVSEMNRITTVVTAGDSVALPPSASGLTIILENAGSNPMQVYGVSPDTINGIATGTGVSQMPNSVVIYTCYTAGSWFAANLGTGYAGSLETQSSVTGLVAHAGGGQPSATPLTAMLNVIATTATTGDSVVLPSVTLPTGASIQITVINNGANSANVFTPSGGTMNGTSNGSSALATVTVGLYFCTGTNIWVSK